MSFPFTTGNDFNTFARQKHLYMAVDKEADRIFQMYHKYRQACRKGRWSLRTHKYDLGELILSRETTVSKLFCLPSEKRSFLGKNLLPLGADSFLIE